MEVEYSQNIIIPNKNFDLCDYFNKFPQISDTIIRIGNKDILVNKEMIMKYSKFFHNFMTDNSEVNGIYTLITEYPINFIKKVISYIYGCELVFNIKDFTNYYRIAEYLMLDDLVNNLREDLRKGFENRKYDLLEALNIIVDLYFFGDDDLNEILLETIANNFIFLQERLYSININILKNIILRDGLNIDSELDLIYFLNYYYAMYQNNKLEIDIKLIPNIRILTLTIADISDASNFLLIELPTYKKFIDKALLSKNNDVISYAELVYNYERIFIPRNMVVVYEFNKRPEISNYPFGEQYILNFNPILPIFSAVVRRESSGRSLKLRIINKIINAEINKEIDQEIPEIGSMILITDSRMLIEPTRNRNIGFNKCIINEYNIIFEEVPKIFYR